MSTWFEVAGAFPTVTRKDAFVVTFPSETLTVTLWVPTCSLVGVQSIVPLAEMVMPTGAPKRLKFRWSPTSGSEAMIESFMDLVAVTFCGSMGKMMGGWFGTTGGLTVILKL